MPADLDEGLGVPAAPARGAGASAPLARLRQAAAARAGRCHSARAPVMHAANRGHLVELLREGAQLENPPRQTHRQLALEKRRDLHQRPLPASYTVVQVVVRAQQQPEPGVGVTFRLTLV